MQRAFRALYPDPTKINFEGLQRLQVDNGQITDLGGLEGVSHLQDSSLANNLIHNIQALVGLRELRNLNLSHNLIRVATSLIHLPNLEYLDLSHNQLKYCFFCSFLQLKVLRLDHNGIQQLYGQGESYNKLLTILDLSHNPLSHFPAKFHAPSLKELNCNATLLGDLQPFLAQTSLEILRLQDCPRLQSLECLFQKTPEGNLRCLLPQLHTLEVSETYLNEPSKGLLRTLREGKLSEPFSLNHHLIQPKAPPPVPLRF
jgi:Leucine-rich repeat (LRR) protein